MDTTTDDLTLQAPQSNPAILTVLGTILELDSLKGTMNAKRANWDTKATRSRSRFFSPEHKLATAMSKVYKSLGELAVAYESPSVYDHKYHNLTRAHKALTSGKAESRPTLEDQTQLDIDESDVIFTVFARIATCLGTLPFIVNFGPCRKASRAYFEDFGSRASGFLQRTVVDLTEENQARLAIVAEATLASEAYVSYVRGEWTTWVVSVPREY